MAEPTDMIIPMLREMRAENAAARRENAALHEQTRALVARHEKRLGRAEAAQKSIKAALAADTLLSRILTGEFEALEQKVRELEAQK